MSAPATASTSCRDNPSRCVRRPDPTADHEARGWPGLPQSRSAEATHRVAEDGRSVDAKPVSCEQRQEFVEQHSERVVAGMRMPVAVSARCGGEREPRCTRADRVGEIGRIVARGPRLTGIGAVSVQHKADRQWGADPGAGRIRDRVGDRCLPPAGGETRRCDRASRVPGGWNRHVAVAEVLVDGGLTRHHPGLGQLDQPNARARDGGDRGGGPEQHLAAGWHGAQRSRRVHRRTVANVGHPSHEHPARRRDRGIADSSRRRLATMGRQAAATHPAHRPSGSVRRPVEQIRRPPAVQVKGAADERATYGRRPRRR